MKNKNMVQSGLNMRKIIKKYNQFIHILIFTALFLIALKILFPTLRSDEFQQFINNIGILGPAAIIIYIVISHILAPLGGAPAMIASLAIYGLIPTLIYHYIASMISATINFYISKKFGKPIVEKLAGKKTYKQIESFVQKTQKSLLIAGRLIGISFFEIISYAAGFTKVSFKKYIIITAIFSLPSYIVFSAILYKSDPNDPKSILYYLGGLGITALIYSLIIKKEYSIKKNQPLSANASKPKLIVILGPTASGKSSLAYFLCKKFNGYIISADSRQFYKGLDISTAKWANKDAIERKDGVLHINGVRHFLIDFLEPCQRYSVSEFQEEVARIVKREKGVPFLVGGTGLYISAVADNFKLPPGEPNNGLRASLEKLSMEELIDKLKELDQKSAKRLATEKNKRRMVRALEVCITTGRPFSQQKEKGEPLYNVLQIGIMLEREELYERINKRADMMLNAGLLNEIRAVYEKYPEIPEAFSAIGCKEFISYLDGKISLETARELHKQNNRRYARKQMTWFKRDPKINWFKGPIDEKKCKKIEQLVRKFI